MKHWLTYFVFLPICFCSFTSHAIGQSSREQASFDRDWLYSRYGLQADGSSVAEPAGVEQICFEDKDWRKLDLPHDWGIEGPFRRDLDGYTGKLPWRAIGWYRKHFLIPSSDKGKQIYVDFDGAMANAEVWLNGHQIGERPYGYSSFRVDLTPFVLTGKDNLIAVRLNTEALGSRWYPGAGIYRHTHLVKTSPAHIAQWGVFVTTPKITAERGLVNAEVTIKNSAGAKAGLAVEAHIFQLDSQQRAVKQVATIARQKLQVEANKTGSLVLSAIIAHPLLWDLEHRNQYELQVSVYKAGILVDNVRTKFGVRTIQFTHNNGFLLNGKRVELQGVCMHHDLGALGAAINIYALKRQLTILKSMGCNAIRTSHNPPAPELLMLADQMGFLIMDEAFDCFEISKDNEHGNDYARHFDKWHHEDLRSLVMRDRNHPSVIMWSMGNEIPEQHLPAKFYLFDSLRAIIHSYDKSRPVTCGISLPKETAFSGVEMTVDVHGMNYASGNAYGGADLYGRFLAYRGHDCLAGYGSETSSTMSSRGVYFPTKYQMSSYDLSEPGWGSLPDAEFTALDKYPAICGEFVWTGFDYLGEPTPFNSDKSVLLNHTGLSPEALEKEKERLMKIRASRPPSRSNYFGIIDLAGFPKDRYYLYQARWRPDLPMVHILPHWNFPDRIGKVTPVFVYTSGDEAELYLNGKSLGRKKKAPYEYRLRWDSVRYEPGTLKAIAYKNGAVWSKTEVKTTGTPRQLKIEPDKTVIKPDGEDLIFAKISVTDAKGLMVPTAENSIECRLIGDGEIVATDNGNPTCLISFSSPDRPVFNGLMLVIIKAKRKQAEKDKDKVRGRGDGSLQLVVESANLKGAKATFTIR